MKTNIPLFIGPSSFGPDPFKPTIGGPGSSAIPDVISKWRADQLTKNNAYQQAAKQFTATKDGIAPVSELIRSPFIPFLIAAAAMSQDKLPLSTDLIAMLLAIADSESGLNPYAISEDRQAGGLFQIRNSNAVSYLPQISKVANPIVKYMDDDWKRELATFETTLKTIPYTSTIQDAPVLQVFVTEMFWHDQFLSIDRFVEWVPTYKMDMWSVGQWKLKPHAKGKWINNVMRNPVYAPLFKTYYSGLTFFLSLLHTSGTGGMLGIKWDKPSRKWVQTASIDYPLRPLQDVKKYFAYRSEIDKFPEAVMAEIMKTVMKGGQ